MSKEIDYSKTAWGDESVRMTANPPTYLLGATVLTKNPAALIVELEKAKPKGAKKLHWRDLGSKAQNRSLEAIARTQHVTTIVTASPLMGNKQERARRKCLQALLVELEDRGVDTLVLETRDTIEDNKDVDFLYYLKRCGAVSHIVLRHARGQDEPCVTIPDQILGAYGDMISKNARTPNWMESWASIQKRIETIDIML